MTYRITGLDPATFAHHANADEAELSAHNAVRVTAANKPGYPCRITLEDAEPGETLILLNHVSHDVATPFRSSHAIYVREDATCAALYVDATPPVFATRLLSLRGFDQHGMLRQAVLAPPGEADDGIRAVFADPAIAYIHAHNAAPGCFAAKVERA